MTLWLSIAVVLHFAWHLIATVGVLYSLYHSDKVHGHSKWKMIGAVVWTVISLTIFMDIAFYDH